MNDDSSSNDSDYIDYSVDEDGTLTSADESFTSSSDDETYDVCGCSDVNVALTSSVQLNRIK